MVFQLLWDLTLLTLREVQWSLFTPQKYIVWYGVLVCNLIGWSLYYWLVRKRQINLLKKTDNARPRDFASLPQPNCRGVENCASAGASMQPVLHRKRFDEENQTPAPKPFAERATLRDSTSGNKTARHNSKDAIISVLSKIPWMKAIKFYFLGIFIVCLMGSIFHSIASSEHRLLESMDVLELDTENPKVHQSDTAVFGLLSGLPDRHLELFAWTLRRTGSTSRVFIITDAPDRYMTVAKLYDVNLVHFQPGILTKFKHLHYSGLRFFIYKKLLELNALNKITHIMLADVSDAFFQRDPFLMFEDFNIKAGLLTFLEERSNRLTHPNINAEWVNQCFGRDVSDALSGSPVSCSGTTLGTRQVIQQYLNYQTQFGLQQPLCGIKGVDQGIHNYIINQMPLAEPLYRFTNEKGAILTVDNVRQILVEEKSGLILNHAGVPYYVIHQFNRCHHILKYASGFSGITIELPEMIPRMQQYRKQMCTETTVDLQTPCDYHVLPLETEIGPSRWSCVLFNNPDLQNWYSVDEKMVLKV